MELGTVLGVWAHPDDEAYLSSGLMAQAVRDGHRVVCVTATRGEGGSLDEQRWPSATLGAVREQELLASLHTLGVTEHVFLDLPDIGMDDELPASGAAAVDALMADVRPDTVLTFGPDGMTGHRAHMSVCAWATESFHRHAPSGAGLFYARHSEDWARVWVPRLEPFDVFRPGTPVTARSEDLALFFRLPRDLLELKVTALSQHRSQLEGLLAVFGADGLSEAMAVESFALAATKN